MTHELRIATFVPFASATLLALAALLALPAAAQVYKWVDKNGKTHYGEQPPDDAKAKFVETPPPGPATRIQDWRQKETDSKRRQIDRGQTESAEKAERLRDQQACAYARQQVDVLRRELPAYRRNAKGEKIYVEDADRARNIAEAERAAGQACR